MADKPAPVVLGVVVGLVVVTAVIVAAIVYLNRTPEENTRVLIVGDSVTYQSIGPLEDRFDWTGNLIIQAYPGNRTDELIPRALASVDKHKPPIIVVLTGYNDLNQRVNTREAMASMMELAGRAECGVWLLLPTKAAYTPEQATQFNDQIEELAEQHGVAVATGWRDSADDTDGPDPDPELVQPDQTHPTPAGSERIADVMADAVERECS